MSTLKKYTPFFASVLLMWMVLYIVYPHYQYYIDPDGTAYLTISKRYANGDYARAINGYWSPWSCWLTAVLIRIGLQPIPASVVINTIGATGFLYISQSFFLRFNILRNMQWLLNVTLALFLVYAVFWQSFDDLWECFFLLSTLRLMLAERFLLRPALWTACGIIGALAYFAKAYSFPFFILNTLCCTFLLARMQKGKWLKPAIVSIATMVACSLPWIWVLHNKYGIWTTSTAGTLNTSWYLVGHPIWKEGITTLLPPPYPDSPYYWEDPWFVNGPTPHFWDSWKLFGMQILRVGYNLWKLLRSILELSIFFPVIAIMALISVLKKSHLYFVGDIKVVMLSFLIFPLGYILVNFESRYLWYMMPLAMLASALVIQSKLSRLPLRIASSILALSFLVYPVLGMYKMHDRGKEEYLVAENLKTHNIKGSFASNVQSGWSTQGTARIAYFSGCSFYANWHRTDKQDMLKEMRRYKVNYYMGIVFPSKRFISNGQLTDENEQALPEIQIGNQSDVQVFRVHQ